MGIKQPISALILIIIISGCIQSQAQNQMSQNQGGQELKNDIPPVIKNLAVEFGPYDPATGKAGDFIFKYQGDQLNKVFWEFGATFGKGTQYEHMMPTLEYDTDPNASVRAIADGIVRSVAFQAETNDYEIFVSVKDSVWAVDYDHIINPTVKAGDTITAGQELGIVGTWNNGLGRTEITVGKYEQDVAYLYCPFKYFDPALRAEYEEKVTRLMSDWEKWRQDQNIYNESENVMPGCLYEMLVEENNKPAHPPGQSAAEPGKTAT